MKIAAPNGSPSALSQRQIVVKIMPAIADHAAVSRVGVAPIPDSVSASGDNARLPGPGNVKHDFVHRATFASLRELSRAVIVCNGYSDTVIKGMMFLLKKR